MSGPAPHTITATLRVSGTVQGVGFRPFVYRLADELGIAGWVRNDSQGVLIEATAPAATLARFEAELAEKAPPAAVVESVRRLSVVDGGMATRFSIVFSEAGGQTDTALPPDLCVCADCLREMSDPADRRYRYPFTNCTNCGPRYSIIEKLPYDRPNTSMRAFEMCEACAAEYHDPADRRFHAQPIACPSCGPRLELWSANGEVLASADDALRHAVEAIRSGEVVAVKGLGGFHVVADASNDAAVRRLRKRKRREAKPLAVMARSIGEVETICVVSREERALLLSSASPIVLLDRHAPSKVPAGQLVCESVAPGNPTLGVMLPYTPLHHLLMEAVGQPIVATSGNLSDEPISIDEREALERLSGVASLFLVHDRPIVRQVDDSVARVIAGQPMMIRRSRGYALSPIALGVGHQPALAVGAHLKNTATLTVGGRAYVSQHIGDLKTKEAYDAFARVIADLRDLYRVTPNTSDAVPTIAADMHPDYLSTKYALSLDGEAHLVQHHFAHVVSCMVDNGLDEEVLGVSWDGTGYGPDGVIWGGEFLVATRSDYRRVGHFRLFPLPGGETAIVEPRRAAIGLLYAAYDKAAFDVAIPPVASLLESERNVLARMLGNSLNSPLTCSVGRLFDAVSATIGIRQRAEFEGQAAMELEFAVQKGVNEWYPFHLTRSYQTDDQPWIVDWQPIIKGVLDACRKGQKVDRIAAKFHNTLVETIVTVARKTRLRSVALTGGCFQNRYLLERAIRRLCEEGFLPYWHHQVPPNDGGISLGQAAIVAKRLGEST